MNSDSELNPFELYKLMLKSRRFEERVEELWNNGVIFGEMHMGTGEEAIMASIATNLISGDAIAADHRGTSIFLLRGTDPVELLLEFMGNKQGLCKGMGGHMHLFDRSLLLSSSGIVGAAGPASCGYALTFQTQGTDNLSVALFGDGAMNQGMLMESFNLSSAWELPVLFICKDNDWAISTRSNKVTGGDLLERVKAFDIKAQTVDGFHYERMWNAVNQAVKYIRKQKKPYFIHAKCVHKHGHFLGDPLFRFHDDMIGEFKEVTGDLVKAMLKRKGASYLKRGMNVGKVLGSIKASKGQIKKKYDPIAIIEKDLKHEKSKLKNIQNGVEAEIDRIVQKAMSIQKEAN